ncbi:MAG: TIGR03621 family F420-dependent LLM class oxidoreductase [Nocardia sp.]|nr:TIGR03621 family F420-dependent LLM class oxidoreductase [Nocardia sp.]
MTRGFRFGVNLFSHPSAAEWADTCRRAESYGFDVLNVPDHLGAPAPFSALVAAADATERPRVGTYVLNVAFWNPVLLAREVESAAVLTDSRLDLGLGTGYVRDEFDRAGIDYPTPRERVDLLERTLDELEPLLPEQRPPILLGGNGNRVLRLAARHADIISFTGAREAPGATDGTMHLLSADEVGERVTAAQGFISEFGTDPELNILLQTVITTDDRAAAAAERAQQVPYRTVDELLQVPTLLIGTVREMADQLRERRERYGFSYLTVLEPSMADFAPVIAELRRQEAQ